MLTNPEQEPPFDIDQFIIHLGLDPTAARESAQSTGSSIAVAVSAMLGIEPREFARLLKEKSKKDREKCHDIPLSKPSIFSNYCNTRILCFIAACDPERLQI